MDHPQRALEVLTAKNSLDASQNLIHLEKSNVERKVIQKQVYEEALKQFTLKLERKSLPIAIVYSPNWHEGVIGIVASKLVENFKIPAIVFTQNKEDPSILKASARTAGRLDLFSTLGQFKHLFLKFGGHKAAAGLSMAKENLKSLEAGIIKQLLTIPESDRTTQDYFDLELSFDEIDVTLVKSLELLEPFGQGNERPIFRMSDTLIDSYKLLKDVHVRWTLKSTTSGPFVKNLTGISFNYIGAQNAHHPSRIMTLQNDITPHFYFNLGINEWKGKEFIQLHIQKIFFDKH